MGSWSWRSCFCFVELEVGLACFETLALDAGVTPNFIQLPVTVLSPHVAVSVVAL